jgi:VWFA-related protein
MRFKSTDSGCSKGILLVVLLLTLGLFSGLAGPQAGQGPGQRQETIQIVAEEVLLDIVARDKRGRPVRDLRQDEIEVFEDGVKQQISSFRIVEGRLEAADPSQPAEPVDPLGHVNLVTLVFERLSTEGRVLARQASLDLLATELPRNTYVAVFTIDLRLYILQHFTKDLDKLRAAVDRATSGGYTTFISESDAIQRELETATAAQAGGEAAASAIGPGAAPSGGMGGDFAEAAMARMALSMLRYAESMQREQQGRTSIFSLLSLVREQRLLPGRKTLVYFSEGLVVTPAQVDYLRSTISAANRSNVSVYAVDARGLLTSGQNLSAQSMLTDATDASRSQVSRQGGAVTRADVMAAETAEASLRANTQETLSDLSTSTGGFLIANSNDLRIGVQRITEDILGYYAVSYRPQNPKYDASFRKITVRVNRRGVQLQTRSGYFALPPGDAGTALPHEVPLLTVLNTNPLPLDFEHRTATLHFDRDENGVRHSLIIEAPLSNFAVQTDKKRKVYSCNFSILALIKDAQGRIVGKFSQNYPLEGPLDRLEMLRKGKVVFTRDFTLPPGPYTLETAATDALSGKASARRSTLKVDDPSDAVGLSSVAIIRRVDQVDPEDTNLADPLRYQDKRIIPNLGDPIPKASGGGLGLYFVVYPSPSAPSAPRLAVQFILDGKLVAQASPELPPPDKQGRIAYVGTLPLDAFPPGQYQIRAVVRQGNAGAEEQALVTISP